MPAPADPALDALLALVRKRCKPALWSQGVTMARAGAVAVESSTPDEIVLRVRAPGKIVPATAVLYPTGSEWECDCPSRMSPCEHVAAAAISLSGAERPADSAAAPDGAAP
ncbi:MAG: SWIM zinc finger family protein, partial [Verrucomicrobiota bacterium]